jgi:hypothetical protein
MKFRTLLPCALPLASLAALAPLAGAQTEPGEVLYQQKISNLPGAINPAALGGSLGALGDVDGDGVGDLVAGAYWDGATDHGAAYILLLNADGTLKSSQKVAPGTPGMLLDAFDYFGTAAAGIGDLDGDGVPDAAVAASGDDDGLAGPSSNSMGALWILFLDAGGGVKGTAKLSATQGGLGGLIQQFDGWFSSVASLGDFDGDGVGDLVVGVQQDDDGANAAGAIYLLFMNANGTVKSSKKISATQGGFGGTLLAGDLFGSALAVFPDLDGNGTVDLAVGAAGDNDGAVGGSASRGAVWILFLDANGDVIQETKISDLAGGFTGELTDNDDFGGYLAMPGDVDGDGIDDLAVGATFDDDGGVAGSANQDLGAIWILFLNASGSVKSHAKISATAGGLAGGTLDVGDTFGRVAALGDLDGDGSLDLAAGAPLDDDGGGNAGAVHVLFLHDELFGAPLGCGVNPPGSLLELSGRPAVGETWTLGVENPLGTQAPGSLAVLAVSIAPDPSYPCGTVLPGFGMASPAAAGELLISVMAPNPVIFLGPLPWAGLGAPAPFALAVPSDPVLAGIPMYAQGALVDSGTWVGLSMGLETAILP